MGALIRARVHSRATQTRLLPARADRWALCGPLDRARAVPPPFLLTQPDISTAHLQLTCPCGPDSLARSREPDENSLPPHLLLLSHSSDSCVYLCATDSGL
ncbi:hypothetical protein QQF64_010382 [Cirrhinus molitorella]|uniref:Uncharacterized protein n=1 Tax=Cirrhinus molitorella TaxID=172907 RepID=A0ABR3M3Y0_9TELE